jgi:hypothetical protein
MLLAILFDVYSHRITCLSCAVGITAPQCRFGLVPVRGRDESSDRLVGSPSRQRVEQSHETRLVRITHRGLSTWLDPFGMLDPQVVVNLLQELGVGVDLVRHGHWLGETNEFHKRPFICG